MFLLLGRRRVLFFAVWAGAGAPPQQQKKRHRTSRKNKNTHPPLPKVFCLGGWAFFFFWSVWARGRVCFFAVWAGACWFFCCLGGGRVFLCCLGRGRVCFLLFGRGTGIHLLTGLPGSSLRDPTTKKDQTAKKHGFLAGFLSNLKHQSGQLPILGPSH